MKIYTVGYEGLDIEDFVKGLKEKRIQVVADVRKNPVSRKRGFSKKKLGEILNQQGIDYIHYGSLGVPSAWRKQAKAKIITREKMFKDYSRKILPEHLEEVATIIDLAKKKKVALLCYECNADDCHRHYIANRIQKMKKSVKIEDFVIEGSKSFREPLL